MHIHTYPDQILKVECEPVTVINGDIQVLIGAMSKIVYENDGIGLAAPQVGIPIRIIVFDVDKKGLTTIINPVLTLNKDEFFSIESCLSIPGFEGKIRRKQSIHLEGIDRYEKPISIEAKGLLSACIQHEVDHLNGVLILDRASRMKKETYIRKLIKHRKKAK